MLFHKHVTLTEEFNWANNNAINAKTAVLDKSLEETHVLLQDQLANATNSLTHKTNAKHAQLDNWLIQPTLDA